MGDLLAVALVAELVGMLAVWLAASMAARWELCLVVPLDDRSAAGRAEKLAALTAALTAAR